MEPTTPGATAVILSYASVFRLHGSAIRDYNTGISAPVDQNLTNRTNVFLYNTDLINCQKGVDIEDGGTGIDRGLVLMDCSRGIQNGHVVTGEDVLLSIDATTHAKTHPTIGVTPNVFDKQLSDQYFKICFDQRKDMAGILARENFWSGGNGANGIPDLAFDFYLKKAGSNGCFLHADNMPINFNPMATTSLTTCPEPPRMPEGPGAGGSGTYELGYDPNVNCYLVSGSGVNQDTFAVHDSYVRGLHYFYWEDFDQAMENFLPVAAIPDQTRAGLNVKCQKYIDEARVFVTALTPIASPPVIPLVGGDTYIADVSAKEDFSPLPSSTLSFFPNPGRDVVHCVSQFESGTIIVRNMYGMTIYQGVLTGIVTPISVSGWSEGVYEFHVMDPHGVVVERGRFMKM